MNVMTFYRTTCLVAVFFISLYYGDLPRYDIALLPVNTTERNFTSESSV